MHSDLFKLKTIRYDPLQLMKRSNTYCAFCQKVTRFQLC